jgi:2,3-bisphosphoglycerate-independent phosphoglycerate mutase
VIKLRRRPVVLIVRDGWGANPHPEWNHANAVHLANTPANDRLMARYPHVLVHTSGNDVGLPDGVMGNSEVGHQNIGAGRIVDQEIMRISRTILNGSFFRNSAIVGAFERASRTGGAVHIMGLCSDGRVHSDLEHLYALLEMSAELRFPGDRVYVHAIMDGRDTPPHSGVKFLSQIEGKCQEVAANPVASVCGRFWAMDRDNRWDRVQAAYNMLTGKPPLDVDEYPRFKHAQEAVRHYYQNPADNNMQGDEFVTPSIIERDSGKNGRIKDGDSVIFFNFRGDRPREIVKAFTLDAFPFQGGARNGDPVTFGFDRGAKLDLDFVTMTAYETGLPVNVAFEKPPGMKNILGAYLSKLGLKQFRCAETEKYAHVTFFFNDYRDEPFSGEDRHLVPSPRHVPTYDLKPEMSALEVTDIVLERIASDRYDVMVVNYANGDMVGHTGSLPAAIRAVEAVDQGVGRIVDAVLARGGAAVITADHGNCEQMIDPVTNGPHTAHTTYDVDLIIVDDEFKAQPLRGGGRLADIAPTLLALLGLERPDEMTGRSLFEF